MASKTLLLPAVLQTTGLSRSGIYLKMAEGSFPKPVSLGARAIGWRKSDIQNWLDNLSEKR